MQQTLNTFTDMGMLRVCIGTVLLLSAAVGYRPVIIIHGLLDGPKQFELLSKFINQSHPGTSVSTISLYDYIASMKPLWQQVQDFRQAILPIMQSAEDGVHLICFSQGGLVCRGVIATLSSHNIHSLIFLSCPLAGQYGDSYYLRYFFPKFIKSRLYHICYTTWGQKVSVCNYWNDPHQRDRYLQSNIFLAPLNGETQHANLTAWRNSFLQVQTLVLIGGEDDGVITPWESRSLEMFYLPDIIFGFYDSNETVVEMEKQDFYLTDVFGLKSLDLRGDVVKCVVPGVFHTSWHSNLTVYQNCIDKWLT